MLFKIKVENEDVDFNINNSNDLFFENGLFESLLDKGYGIATHNYILKIYNVNFKETTPKTILEETYKTLKERQEISNSENIDFIIQVNCPPGYRQLITLYLMPFDIIAEIKKKITRTWRDLKHFEFEKHKKSPLIHNPLFPNIFGKF